MKERTCKIAGGVEYWRELCDCMTKLGCPAMNFKRQVMHVGAIL